MRIVALGECMVELKEDPRLGLSHAFAGDTCNVATYLRRLLPEEGYRVDYLTALGDDPLSERMLTAWRAEGIGTELVQRLPGELPGLYWIHNRPDGDRDFFYWRSASAARQMFRDGDGRLHAVLQSGDLLYLSAISLAILPAGDRERLMDALPALRDRGVRVAYDSNYRPRLWPSVEDARSVHHRMLANADVFLTTFPDEAVLFGDGTLDETADRLVSHEVPEWVLRGDPGVVVTSAGGAVSTTPLDADRVVDTTGAGDSFDAAYLSARLTGAGVRSAVQAGHALAGVVVQHRGAIIPTAATPPLAALLAE